MLVYRKICASIFSFIKINHVGVVRKCWFLSLFVWGGGSFCFWVLFFFTNLLFDFFVVGRGTEKPN